MGKQSLALAEHQLQLTGLITLNHKLQCMKRRLTRGAEEKQLAF